MVRHIKISSQLLAAVAVVCWLIFPGLAGPSQAQTAVTIDLQEMRHGGEFVVPLHKSQILRVDQPFVDLSVGDPEIADILPLTDRTVYVLGKALGTTNLSIFGPEKSLIAVIDVAVTFDIEGLKRSLFEHLPEQTINIRAANGSLVLSGTVSSADKLSRVLAVAERFAPQATINLLSVSGSQQVLLVVRFAEVSRSASKDIGFNTDVAFLDQPTDFSLSTGSFFPGAAAITGFGTLSLARVVGDWTLTAVFDALEEKGLSKTLAEPTLIVLSGDTASFLAGGEFPVPVSQEEEAISVEFKSFGVSLSFTPTVLDNDLINLVVRPEVSEIDVTRSVAIIAGADPVPGIKTRRATTTVELRDGQSFAIAGLLQNNFSDTLQQLPGLGDVPILGALFRSAEFEREETELVVLVTPHLVRPVSAGSLAAPTDAFIPPSDIDLFLFGRIEAPESGQPEAAARLMGMQGAGGISGNYGHIIQ